MIALYHLEDLSKPYATVPINKGNIQGERNGYYSLSFSILNSYLKERSITIDHNTIFKVGELYYTGTSCGSNDAKQIYRHLTTELLQTQVLVFKFIKTLKLTQTSLHEVLREILEGTPFQTGDCDDVGRFDFEVTKQALAQLLKQTNTEIRYQGLSLSIKVNQGDTVAIKLKKGHDFTTLDESTDVSDVITKLYFSNSKGDLSGEISSQYAAQYNFIREGYQQFEADTLEKLTTLAENYLQTVDKPRASITLSIPKIKKLSLELCQTVRVYNTLLNTEIDYKVISYNKSLTNEDDTYQLGERKKDFADIQDIITEEVQNVAPDIIIEVIEKEVISAKTAHILNAWIRDLNVEYLETNFDALDVRKTAPIGNIRNCIRIHDECIDYVTQELSPTEVMDYKNKDGEQIYYTAIKENPQAYQFFTLTMPTRIYPDLKPEQVEEFKVKVRKVLSEQVKASFKFDSTEGDTLYPSMVWGAGTDETGLTNNGKGFIFKDLDGLVLKYITSLGKAHEIKLGEKGIEGLPVFDLGGIDIPGIPVTGIDFFQDGVDIHYGTGHKTLIWTEDSQGRMTELWDIKSDIRIPITWSNEVTPRGES